MNRFSILLWDRVSLLLNFGVALAGPNEKIVPAKACQNFVDLDLSGVTDKPGHIEYSARATTFGRRAPLSQNLNSPTFGGVLHEGDLGVLVGRRRRRGEDDKLAPQPIIWPILSIITSARLSPLA